MKTTKKSERCELDFDHWAELARNDPGRFEQMRLAAIEDLICKAPKQQQQRLRCLQWRIDQERRRSSSALGACIRISRMMWDSVAGPGGLLETLNRIGEGTADRAPATVPIRSAEVIPIDRSGFSRE
jgi:hypothetical protein